MGCQKANNVADLLKNCALFLDCISPLWLGNTWRGNFLFPKDFSKKLYTFQLQGFELINTFQENCLEFPETSFRHKMSYAWPWLIKVFPEKMQSFSSFFANFLSLKAHSSQFEMKSSNTRYIWVLLFPNLWKFLSY